MNNLTANPAVPAAASSGLGRFCAVIALMLVASLSKCSGQTFPCFAQMRMPDVLPLKAKLVSKSHVQFIKTGHQPVKNLSQAVSFASKQGRNSTLNKGAEKYHG